MTLIKLHLSKNDEQVLLNLVPELDLLQLKMAQMTSKYSSIFNLLKMTSFIGLTTVKHKILAGKA